jgi:hypothetical protein
MDLVLGNAGGYRDIVIRHAPTEEERAARQREGLLSFFHGPPAFAPPPVGESSPVLRASDVLTEMDALPPLVPSGSGRNEALHRSATQTPIMAMRPPVVSVMSECTPPPVAYAALPPSPPPQAYPQTKVPSVPPPPVDLPARTRSEGWSWAATAFTLAACLALVVTGLMVHEQRAANPSSGTSVAVRAPLELRQSSARGLSLSDLPNADPVAAPGAAIVVAKHLRQHRIWIDGVLIEASGDEGRPVACGRHTLRVGSSGVTRSIHVPCGTAYLIEQ